MGMIIKKDHIVKEPKVTRAPEYWKKSDYSTTDYSKSSRNWRKDDGKYGSKYSSKDEPKHEPKGHKDYSPKEYKDEPPMHGKKDYQSKDKPKHEPNHHNDYSSKDEPQNYNHDSKTTSREPAKY